MGNGPNPVLVVKQHLPQHIADLEGELDKAVSKVREIQEELTVARTLQAVTPPAPEPKEKDK